MREVHEDGTGGTTAHVLHGSKERKVSHLSNSPSIDDIRLSGGEGEVAQNAFLDPDDL